MYNSDIKWIVKSIVQIMMRGGYSTIVINRVLKSAGLTQREENTHRNTVMGVVENWLYLEYLLSLYVDKKVRGELKCFLMAGLYELHFTDGRDSHAVVNRYVDTAKVDYPKNEKFVNAILRRSQREVPDLSILKPLRAMSLKYSFPEWLIKMWTEQYGKALTEQIMANSLAQRGVFLRVNCRQTSRRALLDELMSNGVAAAEAKLPNAIAVKSFGECRMTDLEAFKAGRFSVQDLSAMLVGHLCAAKPGDQVLDLCSAPGGKALDLAERIGDDGHLIACDIHDHKLKLIEQSADRLKLCNLAIEKSDARALRTDYLNRFDVVLLDAPCSGLGTIGKKPEIKYRKTARDIENLANIQQKMLERAAKYVKIGGNLVYSTCTLNRMENGDQIAHFLAERPNFRLVEPRERIDLELPVVNGMVEIVPGAEWSDGFFIAILKRMK